MVPHEERVQPFVADESVVPYELDEELFYDHVYAQGGSRLLSDKPWFIDFYAPWCGYSKRIEPVWDKLRAHHERDGDVNIGKVDCTSPSGKRLCKYFNIPGYPSLLYFPVTNIDDPETIGYWDYNGQRTLEALEVVAHDNGWKYGVHRKFPGAQGPQQKWESMYGRRFGSTF